MLTIFERTKRHRVSDVEAAQDESDRSLEHRELAAGLAELEAGHVAALPPLRAAEDEARREVEEARARLQAAEAKLSAAIFSRRTAAWEFDARNSALVRRLLATVSPALEAIIDHWQVELARLRNAPLQSQTVFKKRVDPCSAGGKLELSNAPAVGRRLEAIREAVAQLEALRLLSDPSEAAIAGIVEAIPPAASTNEIQACPAGWRAYNT